MKNKINIVVFWSAIFLFTACATYYQKTISFQQDFASGNIQEAKSFLEKNEKAAEKKDRLLYFFDRGVVEHMLGNYEQSNYYFEEAYKFSQDFRKSLMNDLTSYMANPMTKPYQGEDFEVVIVHFYKALNYIYLNEFNAALVECRRINIRLNEINDRYKDKKNRYKSDAFAHLLMGLIYEDQGAYNDAFIAYRNALNVYEELYSEHFQMEAPLQLKKDLLRMAAYNGFDAELDFYEGKFDLNYDKRWENENGTLVFFWLNGLGPVKSEVSLNFAGAKGQGGVFTFSDEQNGVSVPVVESDYNSNADFSDIKAIRMAIPKFKSRYPVYAAANVWNQNQSYPLYKVEDINQIAIATLQDRTMRELASSVGRLAVKQATELAMREKNEDLGTLVSMVNAATEKADTRNWQTLPHSIYYQKIPLDTGLNQLKLIPQAKNNNKDTIAFEIESKGRGLQFFNYHSLESEPPMEIQQ